MITVKYPNDVPWLPGYAVLGSTEAILISPANMKLNARDSDQVIYANKLDSAVNVTCDAIDKMLGVNHG